ncbi:MAG: hypothetical protein WD898_02115 [Candidatus Paceibacterota bacterium]
MNLALIGGNSLKNKPWLEEVKKAMSEYYDNIVVHIYSHWERGETLLDIEKESDLFAKELENMSDYTLFAKSAGIMVALRCINEKKISPSKCIFVGTPIYWAKDQKVNFDEWFKNLNIPTLFIQHDQDPTISSVDLKKLIQEWGINNHEFIGLPGDTHDYPEVEELAKLTNQFSSN